MTDCTVLVAGRWEYQPAGGAPRQSGETRTEPGPTPPPEPGHHQLASTLGDVLVKTIVNSSGAPNCECNPAHGKDCSIGSRLQMLGRYGCTVAHTVWAGTRTGPP